MKYRLLGRSGLRVSEVALGTMTFGDDWGWGADESTSRAMFETFAEAGGNFIDTANNYTNGSSERIVGRCVGPDRDRFVIASKYTLSGDPSDPNAGGNHRKNLERTVRGSLERLGTDHLDILYLHMWDGTTATHDVMRAMDDLVRRGVVQHVAFSDTPAWIVAQAATLAAQHGWAMPVAVQVPYAAIDRSVERDVLPMADALGLSALVWGVLSSGLLTGKHLTGEAAGARESELSERARPLVEQFVEIAGRLAITPSQLAVAWVRATPFAGGPIPILGARTVAQLEDQLGALTVHLDADTWTQVGAIREFRLDFPRGFLESDHVRGLIFGDTDDRLVR